jgi:hypothetical protein
MDYIVGSFDNPSTCHPTQKHVLVDFHYDCSLDIHIMVLIRENHQGSLAKAYFVFKCIPKMLIADV